jgi:hypothetical protein
MPCTCHASPHLRPPSTNLAAPSAGAPSPAVISPAPSASASALDPRPHPRSPWEAFVMLASSLNPARSPWKGPPPLPRIRVPAILRPRSVSASTLSVRSPWKGPPPADLAPTDRTLYTGEKFPPAEEKEWASRKDIHVHRCRPMSPKASPRKRPGKFHDTLRSSYTNSLYPFSKIILVH